MKLKSKLIDIIFVISIPFFSLLVCGSYDLKYMKYLILLSFLCAIFIKIRILRTNIFRKINLRYLIFSVLFSLYSGNLLSLYSSSGSIYVYNIFNDILNISVSIGVVKAMIGFMAMPGVIILVYYLTMIIMPFLIKEVTSLTKIEKYFIIMMVIIGFCLTTFLYNFTSVFYKPIFNDNVVWYDVIYTADSGSLFINNAYLNVGMEENDIRQPLFGFMAMPFSVFSYFLSEFLFFIPNSQIILFNTVQILLISLAVVMISRLLKLSEKDKKIFLIFFVSTFPVMLYVFLLEQYVIAFFYLILTIYLSNNNDIKTNYCYVGAVGTLLVSGIIFPLISKFRNFKYWCINIIKCFMFFVFSMVLTGQFLQLVNFNEKLINLMRFSGKELLFEEKFSQFLYFVRTVFIAPSGEITFLNGIPRYYTCTVDFISVLGIIILIVCLISFILNRKNKMALISILWIVFSFLVVCILGWGTKENGLILYSLYFSWAYIILVYLFFDKILKSSKIKYFVLRMSCLGLISINVLELSNIIMFGIRYYGR